MRSDRPAGWLDERTRFMVREVRPQRLVRVIHDGADDDTVFVDLVENGLQVSERLPYVFDFLLDTCECDFVCHTKFLRARTPDLRANTVSNVLEESTSGNVHVLFR
jgi:hypothetical protein